MATYTVVKGDCLWGIARRFLGDGTRWTQLADKNGISKTNPIIYPGQVINLDVNGTSAPKTSTTSSTPTKPTVQYFGLQAGTDRTLFATWKWSRANTDGYSVWWEYATGDGVWFVGNITSTAENVRQSTYSAPSNATKVRFWVKAISETHTVNNAQVSYWTGKWSTAITYDFTNAPPVTPSNLSVSIDDKYKLTVTAQYTSTKPAADGIQFQIVKDNTTIFNTGNAELKTTLASYSCTVSAGGEYKVRCRAYRGKLYSSWTDYSSNTATAPSAPIGITSIKATSKTSIYLEWDSVTTATIENLNAANAKVNNLEATYGEFKDLTTEKFESTDATIKNLDTKFANVDFSNIGKAAIEQFYATSGIIRDLVIGDQTITGELVGVTIKGDLIEGNTIVADKLVIKGSDGLYYKLNTNGESVESQQTEYNSIHGSVIQAKSITATKIDVKDLVAFGATIGGFHITEDSLYSGVKSSVDNMTRGIYLDSKGQLSLGDKANYLKYYKNQNGEYQLAISAKSISFGVSGSSDPDPDEPEDGDNLVDVINGIQNDINKVRQEITTSLSIESSRGNIFKNDTQAMVLTSVIYHGTERITSISRLKTVFGNSTVSIRWSMQKFNETSFTVISANDSRIGSDGFTFSLAPDDIKNKVTLKCEFILNSLIKASDQITVIDVTDAYSVVLTSETYTFIGGTSGVAAGQSCSTEVAAYCGQNQCSKVSVTQSAIVCPIGISATVTNNNTSLVKITFKTTATISSACEVTIPIVVDGITIYKKFSFAVAKAGAVGPKGDQGVAGKDGKDGATTYFHIKYSSVANPTSSSQISETPDTYIGTYVDFISDDSTDPKKYRWYRFQGLQGKQGEKGIPGENGANGETSYLHIKYSDDGGKTFTSKNGETMGAYIGTYVDFEVDDPTTVKSYSWARIRGDQGPQGLQGIQGEQGKQGIQGEPGKDGKTTYFHIKYSSVANPTASSQMSEIADTYIGTYTDFTEADSTDPKKYTWHRLEGIQGEQGKQGIQGSTGADGKTSYLHIKYSNDAGKTFTGNDGEDSGEYIGTCVDFNKNDPTTVTAYKWSKMKGEVGATGAAGKDGIVISITGSNGFTFKNSRGSTALTAHVFKGGVEQEITDGGICGSLGIIRWYVGTSTTAKATARSITVTADDITNIGSYTCQLE